MRLYFDPCPRSSPEVVTNTVRRALTRLWDRGLVMRTAETIYQDGGRYSHFWAKPTESAINRHGHEDPPYLGFWAAGSAGGISPPAAHRTVRKPLDLHGSSQPFPCHLAMTVDAESDRSSRLLGWRPPSLSWVIRFAPRSLQALRRSYRRIRPRHAHRYFPPSCFALIGFSLRMA